MVTSLDICLRRRWIDLILAYAPYRERTDECESQAYEFRSSELTY